MKHQVYIRKSIDCLEETVGNNIEVKEDSDEIVGGNEEHIIGDERKGDLCYKMAKNLCGMCSIILIGRNCK